jgi:hypothetical protein
MSLHDDRVRMIGLKPSIIGLDGIVLTATEAKIFRPNGDLYGEPDNLLFDPHTKTLYNIEYKCNNQSSNKAYHQLMKSSRVLRSMFQHWSIINLYVNSDYEVKQF